METVPVADLITEAFAEVGQYVPFVEATGSIRIWFPELIVIAPLPLVMGVPAIYSV